MLSKRSRTRSHALCWQIWQVASVHTLQVRDPYYKFSRDPDMSLDTAPYPSGIPRTGRAGYVGTEGLTEGDGVTAASLRMGERGEFVKTAIQCAQPWLFYTLFCVLGPLGRRNEPGPNF